MAPSPPFCILRLPFRSRNGRPGRGLVPKSKLRDRDPPPDVAQQSWFLHVRTANGCDAKKERWREHCARDGQAEED